jgi:alpha-mannosidase
MSWAFTRERVGARVRDVLGAAVRDRLPLSLRYHIGEHQGVTVAAADFDDRKWKALGADRAWGTDAEVTAWLRGKITVPKDWTLGKLSLHIVPADCEILLWLDGEPMQAFDGHHHDAILASKVQPGDSFTIALEAYSGLPSPDAYWNQPKGPPHRLVEAELRLIDEITFDLGLDMQFAYDTAMTLDHNSPEFQLIMNALDGVCNVLDFRRGVEDEAFVESAREAHRVLRRQLFSQHGPAHAPVLWSVGHAHIDTAWLWRLDHTRRKCGRTFSTVLELMKRYPHYCFTCSQPAQYKMVSEDYPEVFAGIREAVKDGRWETVGGMWVEADCNVISGESMVRQFLFGRRYFEREFGTRTNVVWLPDVFGYSAAFPQIIRKAGMKYFMTIKIFWNQVNRPPYQTFKWVGIDGSDVLVHFSPNGDYNAMMTPQQMRDVYASYSQKHLNNSVLYIYGYGDGGGGPTARMLETARRANEFVAGPRVKLATAEAFFEDLEKQVAQHPQLPVWNGELYLEYHRGTYTSQANNKKSNRECEILLGSTEGLCALASLLAGHAYPQALLNDAWELVLLNQFHDIIPGSSITEVYRDSDKHYGEVRQAGHDAAREALASIAARRGNPHSAPTGLLAYNPLSWSRQDVMTVPGEWDLPGQDTVDWDNLPVTLIEVRGKLPALGYAVLAPEAPPDDKAVMASPERLENQFFRVDLDDNGEIVGILDKKAGRQVIDSRHHQRGNALIAFEDKPMAWDAWDVDVFYNDKPYPLKAVQDVRVFEQGPIRAGIAVTRAMDGGRGSIIRQRIFVYRNLPRIDFDTEVEWRERQTLLKVAFPVNVNALRATYDIQFGNIERPTHWNTSWDWARFEVCGHKWADLSEGDYGVSLLSNCKYGWDIRGNVMRLTLLRGPIQPDPQADLGVHRFTYSLYPHSGDWRASQTVQRAYELNAPPLKMPCAVTRRSADREAAGKKAGDMLPASVSFATCDRENLIVETVKKAEDGDAWIVRLYEAYNQRGHGTLTFFRDVKEAHCVELLEHDLDGPKPKVSGHKVSFDFRPYEIKTLRVRF